MILSDEIRRLRTEANLTVRETAAASGLALAAFSAIENGRRGASDKARERIAVALGKSPGYLLLAEVALSEPLPTVVFRCGPNGCNHSHTWHREDRR